MFRSDTMISRLILFVVSTGLLTSICAVCSLTSILLWGDTLIYVAFYFSLGRLYGNSLLATLNARIDIRGLSDEVEDFSFSIKSLSKAPSKLTFCSNRDLTRPSNLSLTIDTVREYTSHLDDEISPSTFHSVVQESTKETPLDL
ncbi:hypothetical protein DL96DRAFT_1593572 [Flagelloscypha sp. PMI_526]|nr:hypothetical protein DL96DRAFT_1593572 [Flagelloscypha sp. PMI_526]